MSSMGMSREAAVEYLRERGYRMPDAAPDDCAEMFRQQDAVMGDMAFEPLTDVGCMQPGQRVTLPVATWRLLNQGVPVPQMQRKEPFNVNLGPRDSSGKPVGAMTMSEIGKQIAQKEAAARKDLYAAASQIYDSNWRMPEPMSLPEAIAWAEEEAKRHAAQDAMRDLTHEHIRATPLLNSMLDLPKMAAVLHEANEKMAQIDREQQEGIQWGDPPPREGLDMAEVGKRLKALEAETFARINAPIPEDGSRDPAPVRRAPPVSVHAWPAPTED